MRFTSVFVAGAFALLANAQSTTSTAASAASSEQAAIAKCLEGCPATDVGCQSKCVPVPNPNEDQVNQTTECVAKCDQGDGSPEATEKYAQCSAKCVNDYYFSASAGTPSPTNAAGSGSGSGSGSSRPANGNTAATASGSATGAAASASGSATGAAASGSGTATGTNAASSSTTTPNAAPALVGSASFGLVGVLGALLL
ncbi:hypothetical protein CCHL11_01794 [Colletotrichum chlorophyti]|uniref:Uncharacterized protein n=1 Tax=Colletotrichum chlorophyti TaxID=708187 RepID=A0A1Q8RW47_9PEZI|nr:hypothetical protein CCHL11_01794 [Colletotrichum chlorophyti]